MNFIAAILRRPYTVGSLTALIGLLSLFELTRMPVDIFPDIDIPVVSVVWTYAGMPADEIQNRILTIHQRQLASLVDDIAKIEATSYYGVGVEKIYLHEGADISRAVSQLSSSALVSMKYMPRNIVPPLILRYGATDVPIIQLSLSSESLADNELNDFGQNIIRPALAVVHGAEVPQPYGGKPRVVMVDLIPQLLQSHGISAVDVSDALLRQNVVLPAGDVKVGSHDWPIKINNTASSIDTIANFPVKQVGNTTIYLKDVAHVHDGFQIQTNSVTVDGQSGVLMTIRKTGRVSTLAVIDGVKQALPDIKTLLPSSLKIQPLFDQSVFVKASINSVLLGGALAAILTALMILLFLGNYRLTLIIVCSIPLSILMAILVMGSAGMTLNTMTLGGFALAVGILVDNATVVIENIERRAAMHAGLEEAITRGAAEVAIPTALATICISIVFVPIYLLNGTAHYLFSPLSTAVILSLLASLLLSFTLVPTLFNLLMGQHNRPTAGMEKTNIVVRLHRSFERGFERQRRFYEILLNHAMQRRTKILQAALLVLLVGALLSPFLGQNFFPKVDAGQFRLHIRTANGTRIEQTQAEVAKVEQTIRHELGDRQIQSVINNIGLPYSGLNIALSDTATVGPMDGEMLVSLSEHHEPVAEVVTRLRKILPSQYPDLVFFFQPADIVNQVLNFGQPAPIDIRVQGKNQSETYALAKKITNDVSHLPGVVDAHIFQVPESPALSLDIDRQRALSLGISQLDVASNVLIATNSSGQLAPNFFIDPKTRVSYPLVVQVPTYQYASTAELLNTPLNSLGHQQQMLGNLASVNATTMPVAISQYNLRPVFDVHADVQGSDLGSVAARLRTLLKALTPASNSGISIILSGQIETMQESFVGILFGMLGAIVLVYLILVINFQNWTDPLVVLGAIPFTLVGVIVMLFISQTSISVPALMGALMCIGLATANSILVVSFAKEQLNSGMDAVSAACSAGYTRLRPVLMTAGAMMLGMVPMAFGVGEGGEQNAPLARAVIGGLSFATVATLVIVPLLFVVLSQPKKSSNLGKNHAS
jgi:multidrug efflux pump subunit AcrB